MCLFPNLFFLFHAIFQSSMLYFLVIFCVITMYMHLNNNEAQRQLYHCLQEIYLFNLFNLNLRSVCSSLRIW